MGERVIAKTLKTQVMPALLAGTGRMPLRLDGLADAVRPGDANAALTVLSLAGQLMRLERPAVPASFTVEVQVEDERAIVPEGLRRPLIRLLAARRPGDEVALTVAWAMDRWKLRLHPFDLPKLDGFVCAHAEYLGVAAQQWATDRESTPAAQNYFDAEEVDAANWAAAPPARRARFIEELRRTEPTAARALVEQVWGLQNPDARMRLLGAMQTRLEAEDQGFLEGLAKDRAPRVRALAQKLLARLPGQSGRHPALEACLGRIQKTTTGLLRKRTVLKLELPATVKEHAAKAWVNETFAEVSCDELARALEITEAEMIEAAEKNEPLLLAFALMATRDRRLDLLETVVDSLPDAWVQMSESLLTEIGWMPAEERLRWAEILIRPYGGWPPDSFVAWYWLRSLLEGPAPEALMQKLLQSMDWLARLQENKKLEGAQGVMWFELIAGLCPTVQRESLRSLMRQFDPALTESAMALLNVLESLEKAGKHAGKRE
jgi:hypothetical protein